MEPMLPEGRGTGTHLLPVVCWQDHNARGLFFRYRDKDFSFTDCTSFVVMQELKLREVLTTDRHFAQAGFTVKP
jgi:predicted nucleic acid-binding protein